DPDNGTVTVTPPANAEPGTSVDIPIKVTYPDGSTEEPPVKVTVTPNQAQENTPGYEDENTTPGNPVTGPQTGDTELPTGTKFEVPPTSTTEDWTATVHPDKEEVTVTPPADAEPGTSVDIPVTDTYLTLTTDKKVGMASVTRNQAQKTTPGSEDGNTTLGTPVTVTHTEAGELPPGTNFEVQTACIQVDWTVKDDAEK
ncbi:hypothetical protein DOS71_04800, partial [Staphylococcus felis]|uniref:YPDG domain-containing protein n=1 Tax=Staphylococcus felis TaxID=46127 RepID=UPI000E368756